MTWREMLLVNGVVLIPVGLCFALSFAFSPDDVEEGRGPFGWMPPCQMKSNTDHPCPTCGMSRAFCAISHGDLRRSWTYNRMAVPAYAIGALAVLISLGTMLSYGRRRRRMEGD